MNRAVLERVVRPAGPALRFVDAVDGRPIADGLRCRLQPGPRRAPLASSVTASGVHHWPAPPAPGPGASPPSPPAASGAELLVDDPSGRFLPLRIAWPPADARTRQPVEITLYGAPGRTAPAGCASVHAWLVDADGRPAAWAQVTVTPAGATPRVGMADAAGRFTLHLPAPAPARRGAGSPPSEASPPAGGPVRAARVELAFRHGSDVAAEAARAAADAESVAPRLERWAAQPACDALADVDGTRLTVAWLDATAPAVLRTAGGPPGRSELRLVPR